MAWTRFTTAALVTTVLLTGCAEPATAPSASVSQGMGMGSADGVPEEVMGVVARSEEATLYAPQSSSRGITVKRVVAPADGWLVARSASTPGSVLGWQRVSRGEHRNVAIPLVAADARVAKVALHVDRGTRGEFEFDPLLEARNRDVPVYTDRIPVRQTVYLKDYGVDVEANSALLLVQDQRIPASGVLDVAYVIVPGPSWIAVNEFRDGARGSRLGFVSVPSGEWHEVAVPLRRPPATDQVLVTVHADRGVAGRFDDVARDPLGSADQPYVSAGVITSKLIRMK